MMIMKIPAEARTQRYWEHLVDVLVIMVVSDFKIRYKGSVLGFAWALITPLLFVLAFGFVFKTTLDVNIHRYSAFTLIGMMAYTWFQSSMLQGATSITANSSLVRRPGFPVAVLPVVSVSTNLVHFLIVIPVLSVLLAIFGHAPTFDLALLPVLLALQFLLTLGLAYMAAAVNVFFRDTGHILDVVLRVLFFLTPIFYEASRVPEKYQALYRTNPLVPLIEAYRDVFFGRSIADQQGLMMVAIESIVMVTVGHLVFRAMRFRFAEEV